MDKPGAVNARSPETRLNAICPYYTMYPLDFPLKALRRAQPGDWVLDPFCGRGTTNFAARLRGMPSVGIDSNPVAAAIASAKMVSVRPEEIVDLCERILRDRNGGAELPEGEFWQLCYHRDTLKEIIVLRNYLMKSTLAPVEIALRAILLGILHGPKNKGAPSYLSNQMPRTYATKPNAAVKFWKTRGLLPERIETVEIVRRKAYYFYGHVPKFNRGIILNRDSRTLELDDLPEKFKWVVTSPPYYGMRTYIPDQWLRYWFLGGPGEVSYSMDGQLQHTSEEQFAADLAAVWSRVARWCAGGTRLVARFGALPSKTLDPRELFKQSIVAADAGWKIQTIRSAGNSLRGRRQASQFKRASPEALEEYDIYAVLEV